MCGIVGVVHREGYAPVSRDVVQEMCDAIQHRGPDDEGIWLKGQVGLGMRRLSIIDLEGGHQPVFNEDGSKLIVFNGEIYNYRELRRELISKGHIFRSHSDTETLIHLYEEMGPRCLERLRGMFAFAIWDDTKRTLLLARDRFGMKPLYFTASPWGIAFASELKALHAVGLASGPLDWDALDMYFRLGYIPAPASPFKNIRKLEPGHLLLWGGDGSLLSRRYWDLPRESAAVNSEIEEQVLEWLDESVAAHLVSDVPLAAFLSGGMDSSAVVSSMALSGDKPHAYTARYHGQGAESADESGLAQSLAERYGARLTIVEVEPDVQNIFEPIVRALDEPHADESAIPTWLISQRVASDYKVALAGTGGDELFAGYRRHIGLLLSEVYGRTPLLLRRAASSVAGLVSEPKSGSLGVHRLKRFLRAGGTTIPERYLELQNRLSALNGSGLYNRELAESISGSPALQRFTSLYHAGAEPKGVRAALYLDYKTYLPDDLLHLSDRLAMAHSLEVRVPFVDHELVERAFPIPDHLKIRWGRNKRLLRRALRRRLPRSHFKAPKRGFVGPTALWLRHELRDMLLDELSQDRIQRLGYFRSEVVQELLEDHFTRRQNREGVLWELLCFSTWHRLYVESGVGRSYEAFRRSPGLIRRGQPT